MKTRRPTKSESLYLLLLERGQIGVTGLDCLIHSGLISGRNELTELERKLNILLTRENEPNSSGAGRHIRYRLQWRGDATAVIGLIQTLREKRKAPPLAPEKVSDLLARYPVKQ